MTPSPPGENPGSEDYNWTWIVETDLLTVGAELLAVIGQPPGRLPSGEQLLGLLHPDDRQRHLSAMRATISSAARIPFECASRILCGDGAFRWIFLAGKGLAGADGRIERVVGAMRFLSFADARRASEARGAQPMLADIWEAGVAALEEREIEKARRLTAEAATSAQRELLATISHEIRNPLSVILANIDLLRAHAERAADAPVLDRLRTLERAGMHLRDLVSDVLDIAKVDEGHLDLKPKWFDLDPLLAEIEDMGITLTIGRDVLFILDAPADPPRLLGDRVKLKQILINLLGNAVKFTERGRIVLRVIEEPDGVVFAMEDTGIGIAEDKLALLFKAFSQIGQQESPIRSTGLGLYISERLARMLGGRMSVTSRKGEGSVFALRVPRVMPTADTRVPEPPSNGRLVIGHALELPTLDPHCDIRITALTFARHIYDGLTSRDAGGKTIPALGDHWEPLGKEGWRFHLRRGVRFHDGSLFGAEDVRATIERVRWIADGQSPFKAMVQQITRIETPSPDVVDLMTAQPAPLLPMDLGDVAIIAHRFARAPSLAFDRIEATIGTGPFQVKARPDQQRLVLSAFAEHWNGPPNWREVEFRVVDSDARTNLGTLLTGEIDLVDNVSPEQVIELSGRDDVRLWSCETNRFWYLYFDQDRNESPFVTDRSGRPLVPNPLKDERVRRAISYAIDRSFLCERMLAGQARPAGDIAPAGVFGANPQLEPHPYDPATARDLLVEAGYPHGFRLTLHGSSDRTFNGATSLRAISLMLNAIGIACRAEAVPMGEYYRRTAGREFSFGLLGWASIGGETSFTLRALLGSRGSGFGSTNRGGYANARFDALLSEALVTFEAETRERLLQQAAALALGDVAIAPICFRRVSWASRPDLDYTPQSDGSMLAIAARLR